MLVGEQHLGRFGLSWRKSSSAGDFDGVIGIEIGVQYFENFFRELDATGRRRALLVRADSAVLAANPSTDEPRFPPSSNLMQSIAGGIQNEKWSGAPSGIRHFFQWRQLDPYPVYVAYAVDEDVALHAWYARIALYTILGAAVWAALRASSPIWCRGVQRRSRLLQRAQRMEAIGQLASGVAHDFNNLLTTVIGNIERIVLDRQVTRHIQQLAEAALRAAFRGSSLTAQLLAFARRQPLHPRPVRIDGLLDSMLPLFKDALGETVDVCCDLDRDVSAILIDPGQFEAALVNLALNARDAMPRGGVLRIAARNMTAEAGDAARRAIPPGRYVVIEITDTGVGMSADVVRRAFEPFFTTKGAGKGSGTGLAMVYGFARQSGGIAEIESQVGSGTTIKLYFPCSEETVSQEPPRPAGDPAIPPTALILVVEDNDEIRRLLANSLEECGHEVRTARAAEEAVEILGRHARIQVLVTDITLPGGMTGLDLARKARELMPDLKILTISGKTDEEAISASRLDRCAFLAKPFRPSDLNRAIGELL